MHRRVSSRQRRRAERFGRLSVDEQFQIDVIIRQFQHVGAREHSIKLPGDERRIGCAEPEGDQRRASDGGSVPDFNPERNPTP